MNIKIKKGPSKHELFSAFSYGGGSKRRISVNFTLENGRTVSCFIDMIEWKDKSGQSWKLAGRIEKWEGIILFTAIYQTNRPLDVGSMNVPNNSPRWLYE
jgi:hypothetical protein